MKYLKVLYFKENSVALSRVCLPNFSLLLLPEVHHETDLLANWSITKPPISHHHPNSPISYSHANPDLPLPFIPNNASVPIQQPNHPVGGNASTMAAVEIAALAMLALSNSTPFSAMLAARCNHFMPAWGSAAITPTTAIKQHIFGRNRNIIVKS